MKAIAAIIIALALTAIIIYLFAKLDDEYREIQDKIDERAERLKKYNSKKYDGMAGKKLDKK